MKKKKITFLLGTRPEVIKLAPVILEARRRRHGVKVVLTGQHRQLALPLLRFFGVEPDFDLGVMSRNQTLCGLSAKLLLALEKKMDPFCGDLVITQGDTTSAFVSSYWAFCRGMPVAHVEAGLRTHQLQNPFPEEANRQLIGRIASMHFAPTRLAATALVNEGIFKSRIFMVGNTAIDALQFTLGHMEDSKAAGHSFFPEGLAQKMGNRKLILVTAHRRESFGKPLEGICRGIKLLVESEESLCAVYPVHPNPNVRQRVEKILGKHPKIFLLEPLAYLEFVALMKSASLILTDSGGVQEEAPSLAKPILVMRETSERPEGIKRGFAKLVGTDPGRILKEGKRALERGCEGRGANPYGDGKSAKKILDIIEKHL